MSREYAEAAIREMLPGMGGWADVDPATGRCEVGILEHVGRGPATRVVLAGKSPSYFHGEPQLPEAWTKAIALARQRVQLWGRPRPRKKPKEADPLALPQEEMDL